VPKLGGTPSKVGIEYHTAPPYNFDKKYGAEEEGPIMENELKNIIIEMLDAVTDVDLLDLVYKILVVSAESSPEWVL
jgi:hypothetical protein